MARRIRKNGIKENLVTMDLKSEEDRFDHRLEHDPRFLRRIEQARNSLQAERGIRLEDIESE
jgi:hypothetical protein